MSQVRRRWRGLPRSVTSAPPTAPVAARADGHRQPGSDRAREMSRSAIASTSAPRPCANRSAAVRLPRKWSKTFERRYGRSDRPSPSRSISVLSDQKLPSNTVSVRRPTSWSGDRLPMNELPSKRTPSDGVVDHERDVRVGDQVAAERVTVRAFHEHAARVVRDEVVFGEDVVARLASATRPMRSPGCAVNRLRRKIRCLEYMSAAPAALRSNDVVLECVVIGEHVVQSVSHVTDSVVRDESVAPTTECRIRRACSGLGCPAA